MNSLNFETLLKRVVFRMLTLILNSRKYFQNTNYTRDDKDLLLHTVVGHIFNQNCRKVNPFCGLPTAFIHHQGKLKYRLGFRNVQIPFLWSRFYEAFSRIIRTKHIHIWRLFEKVQLHLWLNLYSSWWCSTSTYNMKASIWSQKCKFATMWLNICSTTVLDFS